MIGPALSASARESVVPKVPTGVQKPWMAGWGRVILE
jgi:hypothetical protein